jgi:hypothetical protein
MWVAIALLFATLLMMLILSGYMLPTAALVGTTGCVLVVGGAPVPGAFLLIATLLVFARWWVVAVEMMDNIAECDRCMELERAFVNASLELSGIRRWLWTINHNRLISSHLREVYSLAARRWLYRIGPLPKKH